MFHKCGNAQGDTHESYPAPKRRDAKARHGSAGEGEVEKIEYALVDGTCHRERLFQVRQFAENLEAFFDFFAGQRLQTFGTEALHGERSHDATVK